MGRCQQRLWFDVGPWMSLLAWLKKVSIPQSCCENLRQELSPSPHCNAAIGTTLLCLFCGDLVVSPAQQERSTNTSLVTGLQGTKTVLLRQSTSCGGKCPVSLCSRASFAWIHHSLPSPSLLPTFLLSSYHSRFQI